MRRRYPYVANLVITLTTQRLQPIAELSAIALISYQQRAARIEGHMKRILIIEDELLLAMDMERVLQDAGYDVVGLAVDQMEALAAAHQAELAVVDLNLRDGLTGPQIANTLANRHGTKIIYVTANPSLIGNQAETAVGVLMKPFSDAALLAAISYAKGQKPQQLPHQFKPFAEET